MVRRINTDKTIKSVGLFLQIWQEIKGLYLHFKKDKKEVDDGDKSK